MNMSVPSVFQSNVLGSATPFFNKASQAFGGLTDVIGAMTSSETQFFDEERYNESELRANLNGTVIDKKVDAMKRVLAAVSYGRDCGPIFPEVVKNVASPNLELKKLVYIYLVLYGEQNTDLALLAINSFQKDLQDRSQIVRAAALRAMASFKMMEIVQFIFQAIQKASSDQSSYVRKTAAHCIVKLYSLDPDQYQELLQIVLRLLNDNEVSVVAGALMAFHYMCISHPPRKQHQQSENASIDNTEHLALLHPYYRQLCNVVLCIDSWSQTYTIDILIRYGRIFFTNPNEPEEDKETSEDFKALLVSLVSLLSCHSPSTVVCAAVALTNLAPKEEISQTVEPLLRTLQLSSDDCGTSILRSIIPIIQTDCSLWRPYLRDFFVRYGDLEETKELKLEVLILLCNETNVQVILKELQIYVRWQSYPEFVVKAVQAIARIGLKEKSAAEQILRGLVKMLDSKCTSLSSEAVVGVRTLLQRQRHDANDDKLAQVCAQMVRYLHDLKAPSARASVVWILGEYQRDIPHLAPDALRTLAKNMSKETAEVKYQILVFGLKVWAFHALNKGNSGGVSAAPPAGEKTPTGDLLDLGGGAAGGGATGGDLLDLGGSGGGAGGGDLLDLGGGAQGQEGVGGGGAIGGNSAAWGGASSSSFDPEESKKILPRLGNIFDHICKVASYDAAIDVRDMSRNVIAMRNTTKAALNNEPVANEDFAKFCTQYGKLSHKHADGEQPLPPPIGRMKETTHASRFILYSMAHLLSVPFSTYRSLPPWALESSEDSVRDVVVEKKEIPITAISSAEFSYGQSHVENRIQQPSNIGAMPKVVESLEELNLFYADDEPDGMLNGRGVGGNHGCAVTGEDSESSEDGDDNWDEIKKGLVK